MKATKIKIEIEVGDTADGQLLRVVQDEVSVFSDSMHKIGVRCDYEVVEEQTKTF